MKRSMAVLLLVMGSALAVEKSQEPAPSSANPQTQNQADSNNQKEQAGKQSPTAIIADYKDNGSHAKNDSDNNPPNSWWTIGAALVSALAAILTLAVMWRQTGLIKRQADLTGRQADLTDRQNKIMEEQTALIKTQATIMDSTLKETEKAAKAAELSVNAAISAGRPYVFFYGTVKYSDRPNTIEYKSGLEDVRGFNMKNHGSTAAFVTTLKFDVAYLETPPSAANIPESKRRIYPKGSVLSPGEYWPRGWHTPIEDKITFEMKNRDSEENRSKGIFIYLYGEFTYIDAFNKDTVGGHERAPYKTVFCFRFDGKNFVLATLNKEEQNNYT